MPESAIVSTRLNSWKEIAEYVGRNVRTVIRWEQEGGLPVHRVPVGHRRAVFAYRHEIDHWLQNGFKMADGEAPDAPLDPPGNYPESKSQSVAAAGGSSLVVDRPGRRAGEKRIPATLLWRIAVGLGLLALATTAAVRWITPRRFLFAGETQITYDGTPKTGLVTDGSNLYFGKWREGRIILSSVSVNGGPVREIATPFVQAEPVGVSADGRRLLVLAGSGQEQERSLWVVPVQDGALQRVGTLLCHSAASSPDGKEIALASGNSIYLTTDGGASQHLVHTFAAVPEDLRWSLDGKRLLLRLRDMTTWESTLWKLSLNRANPFTVASLIPDTSASRNYNTLSPVLDRQDDAFAGTDGPDSTIFTLQKSWFPWMQRSMLGVFARTEAGVSDFAVDRRAQNLYLLRSTPDRSELDWFDKTARAFRPFLPGISARDVDFSKDGRWIVYVQTSANTLWVAHSDGSSPQQINTTGMTNIELPRWSPDGKWIAFMGKRPGDPFRIFISPASGGPPREASHGTDNQGAPTWSPDGRRLIYGRVMCQEEQTCAIEEIELQTGEQTMIPGSEGLSTARWSPNGRYIAALRADKFQVLLLDRATGKWRKLADGVNGNDLAWALNSSAVYASKPDGDRPEVIRISLSGDKAEPAVDLTSFSKLVGRIDTWFAVTPDDSILFLHIVSGHEVYALHYAVR